MKQFFVQRIMKIRMSYKRQPRNDGEVVRYIPSFCIQYVFSQCCVMFNAYFAAMEEYEESLKPQPFHKFYDSDSSSDDSRDTYDYE